MMKAATVDRYGPADVVRVTDIPIPEPGPTDVRVRVTASSVTIADARIRGARFPAGFGLFARAAFGIRRPRHPVLGSAFAGVVDEVGADVVRFSPGDRVSGMTGMRQGAHAEYAVAAERSTVRTPTEVTDVDAAGILFGGTTALYYLRDLAKLEPEESVLVIGASGAVGTNAVQLAQRAGAHVTAVTSPANADLTRRLGAHRVIDYTRTPMSELTERFDVVMDTVGVLHARDRRRLLTESGRLLLIVGGLGDLLGARGPVKAGPAPERAEDFTHLLSLVAAGELTCVIDQTTDLDGIVEAHRRVDSGRKVGNIVLTP